MEPDQNLGINKIPRARHIFVWVPGLQNRIFSSHKDTPACKELARLSYLAPFGTAWPHLTPLDPPWPHLACLSTFQFQLQRTLMYRFTMVLKSSNFVYFWARKMFFFNQDCILPGIDWFHYQGANAAPTAIVQYLIVKSPSLCLSFILSIFHPFFLSFF